MTFSVAGLCPFPFVSGLPRTGIVLVSDTRYSWQGSSRRFDFGMKICALGSHSGCVCAGSVTDAMNAIAALRQFFDRDPRPQTGEAMDAIPKLLAATDERLNAEGKPPYYAIAVAFVSDHNSTELMLWAPAEQLASQPDWGVVIGDREHQDLYDRRLREIVDAGLTLGSNISFEPDQWVAPYSIALHETFIEQERTPSVGGGIQIGVVSPNLGYAEREMLVAPAAGLQQENPILEWDRISRDVTFDWRTPRQS